jgi:hypothetical protein
VSDRALTLHQPWAQLIRDGRKLVETRSWHTAYRGPLSIHAGKTVHRAAAHEFGYHPDALNVGAHIAITTLAACIPTESIHWDDLDGEYGLAEHHAWRRVIKGPLPLDYDATDDARWETIVDSDQIGMGDFTAGRYAWLLTVPEQIDPVRARGRQGLWRVEA